MRRAALLSSLVALLMIPSFASAGVGDRLAYLDGPCDPYGVGLATPRLITPQWVGQPGVEAVIVLAIDDLSDTAKYESFLRPILRRLGEIDGRAAVSMMATRLEASDPQLQKWLREGSSVEAHTWSHPCPLLQGGDLAAAKRTFDRSVDRMASIPGNRPVAFRTPCCDSMSSVSPRLFTEIFGKTTPGGKFLAIDSSVFHLFTADDPALPRELVLDAGGKERSRKYVPTERGMASLIEDYPYPYVIDRLCWEIPCLTPSDWQAQNRNGVCSPVTVGDLNAAIDATVVKRGVLSLCFHPHGWVRNDQVIELIDHAVAKHGKRIQFLTFRDVYDRLTKHLLDGEPLRAANGQDNAANGQNNAADGQDNGVRVLDLDNDGYMDVVIGNERVRQTRVWLPAGHKWQVSQGEDSPRIVAVDGQGNRRDSGARFFVADGGGRASCLSFEQVDGQSTPREADFTPDGWRSPGASQKPADAGSQPTGPSRRPLAATPGVLISADDPVLRFRDLDGDGRCEAICRNREGVGIYRVTADGLRWEPTGFSLPEGSALVDDQGRDAGLRLVDLDEDGRLDVVFSGVERYSIHLFVSMEQGWSRKVLSGRRGDPGEIPPIVRPDGTNNGAWFAQRQMWVQNEDTGGKLPHHVFRRHFTEWLDGDPRPPAR